MDDVGGWPYFRTPYEVLDTNGDPHLSDPRGSNQEVCPKVHGKLPARECRSSLSLYIPSDNQAWLWLDVVPFSLMIFPAINLHLGVFQRATFDYQRLPGVYPIWSCPKIWYPLVPFSTDWFIRLITDGWLTICLGAACCPLCIGDYHDSWTAYNPFLTSMMELHFGVLKVAQVVLQRRALHRPTSTHWFGFWMSLTIRAGGCGQDGALYYCNTFGF